MQHDAVHTYHWMTATGFLNAVALGQVTPGPVVATVAAVGYAAHGLGGGVLAAAIAFAPSFLFVLVGGGHFDRLRERSPRAGVPRRRRPGGDRRDPRRGDPAHRRAASRPGSSWCSASPRSRSCSRVAGSSRRSSGAGRGRRGGGAGRRAATRVVAPPQVASASPRRVAGEAEEAIPRSGRATDTRANGSPRPARGGWSEPTTGRGRRSAHARPRSPRPGSPPPCRGRSGIRRRSAARSRSRSSAACVRALRGRVARTCSRNRSSPPGLSDPPQLRERPCLIAHGAEHEARDGAVEARVGKRELLGHSRADGHRDRRVRGRALGLGSQVRLGLERDHLVTDLG